MSFYQLLITFLDNDKNETKTLPFSDKPVEDWNLIWDAKLTDELKI